jgi:CRP/FNR family cyclic AMP-dependent transcriptional regulator
LFAESPYPARLVAAENSELVHIPRKPLLDCMSRSSAAAMCLLRVALKRLSRAHRQTANLALGTVYIRVVQVLLENGHELNSEWHVTVRPEEIAEMVGASREMVNKVLRCMLAKRVIRREKRQIIVMDRDAFRT